jgi:hypothetical protein
MKPVRSHTTRRLVWTARGDVERDEVVEPVVAGVGEAHDQAVDELEGEQEHAGGEEPPRDALGFELHGWSPT